MPSATVQVCFTLDNKILPSPSEITVTLTHKNFSSIYKSTQSVKNTSFISFKDVPYGPYKISVSGTTGEKNLQRKLEIEISTPYKSVIMNYYSSASHESSKLEAKEGGISKMNSSASRHPAAGAKQ